MIWDRHTTVAFSGHRDYSYREAESLLYRQLEQLYDRGFRTFLSGMAVGFDLAAAESVVALREVKEDVRLVAVVPFRGQQIRFSSKDQNRYREIIAAADVVEELASAYYAGCYAVRNDFLVDHAAVLVAWYDGHAGGTRYTVSRALRKGLRMINLYSAGGGATEDEPLLF